MASNPSVIYRTVPDMNPLWTIRPANGLLLARYIAGALPTTISYLITGFSICNDFIWRDF